MKLPTLAFLSASLAAPAAAQVTLYDLAPDSSGSSLYFGRVVAWAGDVDGDGVDDVAVGSPFEGSLDGGVRVFSGRDGSLVFKKLGQGGDQLGRAVCGLGDVDGDGFGDLAIGAPAWGINAGQVHIVSGATGNAIVAPLSGVNGDMTGTSVAYLGDVDADGKGDFAMGSPGYDPPGLTDAGRVIVVSGGTAIAGIQPGYVNGEWFGYSVGRAGDLDGDGRDDLLVGSPKFLGDRGRAIGFSLAVPGSPVPVFFASGTESGAELGFSVSTVGDVDGDGVPDVACGAPSAQGLDGAVRVYSGATGLFRYGIPGPAGSQFGWSVAGVGDQDGDGRGDFLVGAPFADLNLFGNIKPDVGVAYLYSGVNGSFLYSWLGTSDTASLGWSVASVGDLNQDGYQDFGLGRPGDDQNAFNSGTARIVLAQAAIPSKYCTGKANSQGCTPSIAWSGCPSASVGDNFHVTASNLLNQKAGLLVLSWNPGSTPLWGGTLCLGVSVKRTPMQWTFGSSAQVDDCTGSLDFWFSHAYMQTWGYQPGQTLYCQYWSRDPGFAAPNDVSLSNALTFTIAP